jgi:hypothetical protein
VSDNSGHNLLLSKDSGTTGLASISLVLNPGDSSTPTFYVQAQPNAGPNYPVNFCLLATATDYQQTPSLVHVMASGFVIPGFANSFSFTTTVGSADTSLQIYPASLDSSLNLFDTETLIPGTSVQALVKSSQTCGGALDQSFGSITVSPVVFHGADIPNFQSTSFHPASSGGSEVIYIPAPVGTGIFFKQASNNNCITANVN